MLDATLRSGYRQHVTRSHVENAATGESNDANALGVLATGVSDVLLAAVQRGSRLDLTATTALFVVAERPGQSVSDLASALSLTHSGAVRVVDRLAALALLARENGPDRRSVGLVSTDAGRCVVDAAIAARRHALRDLVDHLPPSQRAAFLDGARTLVRALPTDRCSAHRICRLCEHDACRGAACPVGSTVTTREARTTEEDR